MEALDIIKGVFDFYTQLYSPGAAQQAIITRQKAIAASVFGRGEVGGIQRVKASLDKLLRTLLDSFINRYNRTCSAFPSSDFISSIFQRVPRVFELQNSRPSEFIRPIRDTLKDFEHGFGLVRDPWLTLIIKRTIKTVEVEIQEHGEASDSM